MNCDQARQKMLDCLYGELPQAEMAALVAHLSGCPACGEEWKKLHLAREALARWRVGEPAGREVLAGAGGAPDFAPPLASVQADRQGALRGAGRRRRRPRPFAAWIPVAVGIAAVLLAALALWLVQETATTRAFAQGVQITRLNVSLTILSEPADWARGRPYPYPVAGQAAYPSQEAQARQGRYYGPGGWGGRALVRDQRVVRNLPRGVSEVRFSDVPSAILPDSVRLRGLDRPEGMSILEQNYQYDLASAWAVLRRYVDRPVRIIFNDGRTAAGDLLSFDGSTLVVRRQGQGPVNIARDQVQAVALAQLPEGLLSKPTLVWQLSNQAAARQQFEVAYLTGGLSWRADYLLKLHPAKAEAIGPELPAATAGGPGKPEIGNRKSEIPNPKSAIWDAADLVGYATVTNNSGVTYQDAQLKLLAGDVHIVQPEYAGVELQGGGGGGRRREAGDFGFQEKSFFEYHLYTLGQPTTLRSAEVKQIELVTGSGLKLRRLYVYDHTVNATAAKVVSELVNSKANGLGKPLPKGVVRLYAPDAGGQLTYSCQTTIDHTPVNEKIRFYWGADPRTQGFAFDIACSATQSGGGRQGDNVDATWQYDLRNHKDRDVAIIVVARVPATTLRGECNFPWHVRQVGLVEIEVPVPANAAAKVTFSYRYNPVSGGGLKSPHDQ